MMQQMLESGGPPSPEAVHHIDRCLSCLGCRTACPSSVDYARLADRAREHIEKFYRRALGERLLRWLIAKVLTRPGLVKRGLLLARLAGPLTALLPGRLRALARMGAKLRVTARKSRRIKFQGAARRIALMPGCVQNAIAPGIDAAVARVLARRGIALVPLEGAGCCGALPHHLGREEDAKSWAKRAIEAYERGEYEGVLITATGCSAHLKDLGHLFLGDPVWESRARAFASASKDFLELAAPRELPAKTMRVAYHLACSQANGLKVNGLGEALLKAAGFTLLPIPEGHLCCGSAGSYSILQPKLAGALRKRKLAHIESIAPDLVVSGNIGCLNHLAVKGAPPMLHIAQLLDWAEGGPVALPPARR
jgi:glycolate oxidase iron-sulfur subunit